MPYYPPVSMEIGETVTSGTAGSVLFVGTGPVLAQDNANLFWDDTNNRLGIGTASPTFTLEAKNASTGNIIKAFDSNGVNVTAASDASGRAFLSATGVNLGGGQGGAYFTASGYQEAWFNVECTSNTSGQRYVRFGNYANVFSIQLLTDSAAAIARTPFSLYNSAPTDSLVITATGLVGINSPGAQAQLHVTSSSSSYVGLNVQGAASQAQAFAAITDSAGNVLVVISANSGALGGVVINEQGSDADVRIEGDTDTDLLHTDASTDRVGIGIAAPDTKLHVAGTTKTNALRFTAAAELTIAAGVVTRTQAFHRIDTEADGATDDLDTINGGTEGDLLVIRAENGARDVVVKDGTGNIQLAGADFTMDNVQDTMTLIYDGTNWLELCRSNNGA